MARNPNVAKMNRQRFERRRGRFKQLSDPSTKSKDYAKQETKLRRFWGEMVSVPSPVGKSDIPLNQLGYFDYRGHVKARPDHREDDSTPASLYHLMTIFPGAKFIGQERQQALLRMRELMVQPTQPENHIVVCRTKSTCLRLYFSDTRNQWWFVLREWNMCKASITYGTKERALALFRMQKITYFVERSFAPDSS